MEILGGNFLTSPSFDCTPGYAPELLSFINTKIRGRQLFHHTNISSYIMSIEAKYKPDEVGHSHKAESSEN